MFKDCKVVMLPIKEKAEKCILLYNRRNNPMVYTNGYITQEYLREHDIIANHLYIVSDEEIKEGDYRYSFIQNNVERVEGTGTNINLEYYKTRLDKYKKIIATTDSFDAQEKGLRLPKLSQSFIDKYITEYNKGNIITNVMVEYEDNGYEVDMGGVGGEDVGWMSKIELKVNPKDNTITIKRIKNSWSRLEIEGLFHIYI